MERFLVVHRDLDYVNTLMAVSASINQSSINQQDVKSLPVPLPPLELQRAFERRVQSAESILNRQTEALNKAMATFDALLSRTFS